MVLTYIHFVDVLVQECGSIQDGVAGPAASPGLPRALEQDTQEETAAAARQHGKQCE